MRKCLGDINLDYPLINTDNAKKYILGIYPQYHSIMFPDSILTTENPSLIKDISYGNSIHKIYICRMNGIDNPVDLSEFGIQNAPQSFQYVNI